MAFFSTVITALVLAPAGLQVASAVQAEKEADEARRASALATQAELEAERGALSELLAENEAAQGASGLGGESPFRLRLRNIQESQEDQARIAAGGAARGRVIRAQGRAGVIRGAAGAATSVTQTGTTLLTSAIGSR